MTHPFKILLTACILLGSIGSKACTSFCLRAEGVNIMGKNYDWQVEHGHLLVNPRGLSRTAMVWGPGVPLKWTSQFGSVTFNQYGRDFPNGGMNEAGLAVEVLWLNETRYAKPDQRPVIEDLQWVQYQLDSAETVYDVVSSDEKLRLQSETPLHFFVSDRHGASATIEILNGKMTAHFGETLPYQVLTNHTYKASLNYLKERGSDQKEGYYGRDSLTRFAKAVDRVTNFKGANGVDQAFQTLEHTNQGDHTKWQIVYDLSQLEIHFRTRSNAQIKRIDMKKLDFSCNGSVWFLDLAEPLKGEVNIYLRPWTEAENRAQLERAFNQTSFLAQIPASDRDLKEASSSASNFWASW